jgi:tRNA pseudouridine55 synthase
VVDQVERIVRPARAGHAGTLDPLATGVLVVCVGWTTRLIPYIQEQSKGYRATFLLGHESDTDDVTGQVTPKPDAVPPTLDAIAALLPEFTGEIDQVPPQYSAVHVEGKRAYKLARAGKSVELAPRKVVVHRLEIVDYAYPRLELDIECGSGTYVRSIGRDLGARLGCGAVMSALVRTRIGCFRLEEAVELSLLTHETLPQQLRPPRDAVGHRPHYQCTAAELLAITQGRPIAAPQGLAIPPDERIVLLNPQADLAAIATYRAPEGRLAPLQVFTQQMVAANE